MRGALWTAVPAERTASADELTDLDDVEWTRPSLWRRWTAEDVVAYLIAVASVGGRAGWPRTSRP